MKTILSFCFAIVATANCQDAIARSHIDANVPPHDVFEKVLTRDLRNALCKLPKQPCQVEYELLRKGPTQTGIAYPKYYAWVKVANGESKQEGAVRLAAVDMHFEVTDFLAAEKILKVPESVAAIFPAALSNPIRQRAQAAR
jgi:hypothetical protein